jgi:hypothetical protein
VFLRFIPPDANTRTIGHLPGSRHAPFARIGIASLASQLPCKMVRWRRLRAMYAAAQGSARPIAFAAFIDNGYSVYSMRKVVRLAVLLHS